jgi:hypothetical protein
VIKNVTILIIYKKGDIQNLNNYRGISLISHFGKLLEKLMYNRLSRIAEKFNWIPETQNGFRKDRSTIDSIFISNIISSLCKENGIHIFKIYIDLVKAYDKINHNLLWLILKKRGVPSNFLNLIKNLYIGTEACIKTIDGLTNSFSLNNGLKQGSILSPLLFNIFFGCIIDLLRVRSKGLGITLIHNKNNDIFDISNIKKNKKDNLVEFEISNILFADDSLLISDCPIKLQKLIIIFDELVSAFGLEISIPKSEIMINNLSENPNIEYLFYLNNQNFKNSKTFKYLGCLQNTANNMSDEINSRIMSAYVSYSKNKIAIFNNRDLSFKIILSNFKVLILSVLLYGCEIWVLNKNELFSLERLQFRLLKQIFRLGDYKNRISYLDLLMLSYKNGVELLPIDILIRKRRLTYFGKIMQSKEYSLIKMIINSDVKGGKRRSGGVGKNYRSIIKDDFKQFDINILTAFDSKLWLKILSVNTFNSFKKFCLMRMSETNYNEVHITDKGRKVKTNTIYQLNKMKIFISVDEKRGRMLNNLDLSFSDF